MRNRRLARCLIYPVLLLAVAPGCQAMYQYRPVAVLVRDAETKQPIPGAEVSVSYPLAQSSYSPWLSSETTGNDGVAGVRAAPYGEAGVQVDVTAPEYLSEVKTLSTEEVKAIEPAHLFETVEHRPPSLVLELYARPDPTVELVVPTNYRGDIKVEVKAQEGVPCPAGQRCFRCEVPSSGVAQVVGPPLLRHVVSPDFRARYADGTLLTREAKDLQVGFWWLKSEGKYQCFLVGTRGEYETRKKDEAGERRTPAAGKDEGRGKRFRRQSQPPPPDAGPQGMGP